MTDSKTERHAEQIEQQFTAQAEGFARSPALHSEAALALMVEAGAPQPSETMLDVACGPGSVVAAYASRVRWATGIDATEAMLDQARALSAQKKLQNVTWLKDDVYALPFEDRSFDIVTCRFAMHHLQAPDTAFAEMMRVCRPGGRIVVCDGFASADPEKASALNAFERLRDPSTVGFLTMAELEALFLNAGCGSPQRRFYKHPGSLLAMLRSSHPVDGDKERLREIVEASLDGDGLGLGARREEGDIVFETPIVILSALRPS